MIRRTSEGKQDTPGRHGMHPPGQPGRWPGIPDVALRTALRVSGPVEGFGVGEHAAQPGLISAQDADLERGR